MFDCKITSYYVHSNSLLISHSLFTDDIIIFTNGNSSSLKKLVKFIEEDDKC